MREIKFRAKSIENDNWVYGYYVGEVDMFPPSIITEDGKSIPVIKETIGQYTGFDDKNGQEIYEDDIIRYSYSALHKYGCNIITEVRYLENTGFYPFVMQYGRVDIEKLEIIGNKYDNPELLEV